MLQVVEFNDLAELAPYYAAWNELLARSACPSFFRTPEWLEIQWRHVGQNRKLRVLVMLDGSEVRGLLPCSVQNESTKLGDTRLLGFSLDGWGSYYGPIGPSPREILNAGLEHFHRTPRDYDVIDMRCLIGDDLNGAPEASPGLLDWTEVARIELVGGFEEYLAERNRNSSRFRNVARCERRLNELGEVTHVRYRPRGEAAGEGDPRWDLYDQCVALAQQSWQHQLTEGNTLSHSGVREFLREVHAAAARLGKLDLHLLYLDGRPIAFMYAYHNHGHVDVLRIGFDGNLAKVAPGNALWTRFIRGAYASGDRALDLGPTCLDYKQLWINRLDPTRRLLEYSLSPKAQALRLARWFSTPFRGEADQSNRAAKQAALENGITAG